MNEKREKSLLWSAGAMRVRGREKMQSKEYLMLQLKSFLFHYYGNKITHTIISPFSHLTFPFLLLLLHFVIILSLLQPILHPLIYERRKIRLSIRRFGYSSKNKANRSCSITILQSKSISLMLISIH